MLSCEFDVPIGLNPPLTVLSAVLAVSFTFGALSTDLIQKLWRRPRQTKVDIEQRSSAEDDLHLSRDLEFRQSSEPLLRPSLDLPSTRMRKDVAGSTPDGHSQSIQDRGQIGTSSLDVGIRDANPTSQRMKGLRMNEDVHYQMIFPISDMNHSADQDVYGDNTLSAVGSQYPTSPEVTFPTAAISGTSNSRTNSVYEQSPASASNTLVFAVQAILNGLTLANISKGFVWSIALTNMHFMGVKALDIPGGYVTLSPARLILCGFISWSVCCVGVILMAGMEVNLKQQILFSVVAATGVAAVHFSGS
jgi:hypothetical protein